MKSLPTPAVLPISPAHPGLSTLVDLSEREGFGFVRRLVAEWQQGKNRFDRSGERLFGVETDDGLVAVCGLNVDPYGDSGRCGRLRHLFVSPGLRRTGLGRKLVAEVLRDADTVFDRVDLRSQPSAFGFYEAIGFEPVGEPFATHRKHLC